MADSLTLMGSLAQLRGDLAAAQGAYEEALALFRRVGDRTGIGHDLLALGGLARQRGDLPRAEAIGREALAAYWEAGSVTFSTKALAALALTAAADGRAARAVRLLGAAEAALGSFGGRWADTDRAEVERWMPPARAALGEEAWATAHAAGAALPLEEAIAEALGESEGRSDQLSR
jgi:tetratricopeptide (TPR) repeat protein